MMKDYCDYGKITFHITLTPKEKKKETNPLFSLSVIITVILHHIKGLLEREMRLQSLQFRALQSSAARLIENTIRSRFRHTRDLISNEIALRRFYDVMLNSCIYRARNYHRFGRKCA